MSGKTEFRMMLAEDRESVTLETVVDGKPLACGIFPGAQELDDFIEILGAIREQMTSQIPPTLDPQPRLRVMEYPRWWIFDPEPGGRLLALRHTQFGWLGFLLGPEAASDIAKHLGEPRQPDQP